MPKFHPQSSTLSTILGALRAQGKTIVLANGCFDLLHVGHVRFLADAKSRGDYLVVAINSDESVRANKGEDRPIIPEAERAEVLASLECVDYVTIFGETTADEILKALHPTLHAKGTDYDPTRVPEADTLKLLGVNTVICGDPKDHSTRDLVARLRAEAAPAAPSATAPEAESSAKPEAAKGSAMSAPAKRLPEKAVKPQPKAKPVANDVAKPIAKPAPKKKAAGASRKSSAKA
ncbi:MAG: adenylyltransferase/cytidyltransferase family protein [Planctomycetes bacterium]|nr:adenylyltransferase/cytidyltransferase family protein [Planctomycetota bacterium]